MAYRTAVIAVMFVFVTAGAVFGGGSVFSANGVGEEQVGGGTRALGLGGGAFGLKDTMSFNAMNPALFAFAPRTAMRIGGHVAFWNTTSNGLTDSDGEMAWKDLGLILPLSKRWKLGLGLQPTRRQDVHTIAVRSASFPGDTTDRAYEERLTWSGSTVDVRLDNAYRFSERFSLGVAAIYSILHDERTAILDFEDTDFRDVRYNETTTFRGWSFSLGGYYAVSPRFGVGGFYRPRLQGSWTSELSRIGTDATVKRDGRADAPGEVALGFSYRLSPTFIGVADVRLGQWESGDYGMSINQATATSPDNPLFVSFGAERLAGQSPVASGFDLWGYRAGAFYRKHYWTAANDASVEDVGMSLGFSIPVAKSSGRIHAAAELGQRGLDEKKLGAQELFARLSFQVEIGETWFQRAKPRIPE